jgi:lipoyl(octanoyl) transferase
MRRTRCGHELPPMSFGSKFGAGAPAVTGAKAVVREKLAPTSADISLKMLGRVDYAATLDAMRRFTAERNADSPDEIWLCEHPPVYTQGIAGKAEHLHADLQADPVTSAIPVIQTERGGQVTYHGPGQVVAYPLVDLKRLGIYVKEYVYRLEQALLRTLEGFGITGHRVEGAPGIYVRLDDPSGHAALVGPRLDRFEGLGKIAALGVKVTRHCTYHGVALNVAMDLRPFSHIDPCGFAGLRTVDLATLGVDSDWAAGAQRLGDRLAKQLRR